MKSKEELDVSIEDNDLTDKQWEQLQKSITQAKEGKVMSIEEFLRRMKQWRINS